MKNQFFGDKRDYLKYSLLETLATRTPDIRQLTCIWLLTPDTGSSHGSLQLQPCRGHEDLAAFLTQCRIDGIRDVRSIERYFAGKSFRFNSFGSDATKTFGLHRDAYFAQVDEKWLHSAVVFLDPDNGMEPAGGAKPSHVTYAELHRLFHRMDSWSIAVVYQHLPRRVASLFWEEVATKIAAALRTPTLYVAESDVAFYLIPKTSSRVARLDEVLRTFAESWTVEGQHLIRKVGVGSFNG